MEPNEQQNKSTRTFEEWKEALVRLIFHKTGKDINKIEGLPLKDEQLKPYYDQGLMPDVCYQELFNR